MASPITEAELLDALSSAIAGKNTEGALTLKELAAQTKLDERKVRVALQQFAAEGRLQTHKVQRTRLNGHPMTYVGFTIAPAKKKR